MTKAVSDKICLAVFHKNLKFSASNGAWSVFGGDKSSDTFTTKYCALFAFKKDFLNASGNVRLEYGYSVETSAD